MHKKITRIVCSALALILMLSVAIPCFADQTVSSSGGTGSVPVELTADAASFSVTVPTSLPIQVSANGEVTTSTDAKVVNGCNGPIKITSIEINASNGWTKVDYSDELNFNNEVVGTKKITMKLNNIAAGDVISGGAEKAFTYSAKIPVQVSAITDQTVASVVFTVDWDTV